MTGRYHIDTRPAPAAFAYPAKFRLGDGDDYVKYGHAPFEQGRHGGDAHWTAEVITQTWFQAETGRIPISGAGYGGAIYVRDPHHVVSEDQLHGGRFMPFTGEDWALIRPCLEENERQFGIRVEALLTVVGEVRRSEEMYRKVGAVQLEALTQMRTC